MGTAAAAGHVIRADVYVETRERAREATPVTPIRAGRPRPAAHSAPPAVALVPLTALQPHPRRVRDDVGDLAALTASIRAQGVLVPLMAERRGGTLLILHGHRRAGAAICAGLHKVPCLVVSQQSDADAIALMLATKEHRRHLTPAERQRAVVALRDEFGWTMPQVAERLGISESSAYRWSQGEDAATVRKDRPPRNPANPRTWGGRRGTRKPRIQADKVLQLLDRWRDQVTGGLNPDQAQALLAEVEDLLQGWAPEPAASPGGPR